MSKDLVAVLDLDGFKYSCASVGEKRTIAVSHKPSGRVKEFSNRTEFWGHHLKKEGGWLGEVNKSRDSPFSVDEFEIEDIQTPEPIENALHTAKQQVDGVLQRLGTKKYKGFIGKGDSFRLGASTLLEYKGNRKGMLRPLHLDEVTDYLTKKYKAEVVTSIEADDRVVMESHGKDNHVIVGVDKDYYGTSANFFNYQRPEEGVIDCTGFGRLYRDGKKIRGIGRLHLYWQMCSQDEADNYKASCFSDVKWGEVSAYNALKDCTNDKESWTVMRDIFQLLYPEPKVVKGWRGDDILIDWKYVLSEMFVMARMLRWEGDNLKAGDILSKYDLID